MQEPFSVITENLLDSPHRRTARRVSLFLGFGLLKSKSGRADLNRRPLAPQASALARLRYGPNGNGLRRSTGRFNPNDRVDHIAVRVSNEVAS
jgi:hypothetical protein